jgi:magnesium-transporting ATPase (P-type)
MPLRRSRVDWILEAAALIALIVILTLVAWHWGDIPVRPRLRFGPLRGLRPWSPHLALEIIAGLGTATYVLLTVGGQFQRLISFSDLMDRNAPQMRQLVLSMTIVLKAIIMVLFAYLAWTLIQVSTGHSRGIRPAYLALFVAVVPAPLILYTVKLRRYRK